MTRDFEDTDDVINVQSYAFTENVMTVMIWASYTYTATNDLLAAHWLSWGLFGALASSTKPQFVVRDGASNKSATADTAHNDGDFHPFIGRANGTNSLLDTDLDSITGDAHTNIDDQTGVTRLNGYPAGGGGNVFNGSYYCLWDVSLSDNEVGGLIRGANPFAVRHANKMEFLALLPAAIGSEDDWSPDQRVVSESSNPPHFAGNGPIEQLENYL